MHGCNCLTNEKAADFTVQINIVSSSHMSNNSSIELVQPLCINIVQNSWHFLGKTELMLLQYIK